MCRSMLLIVTSLFLLYCFAIWLCIVYFTLMHVIIGKSTCWSVMGISDIVIYVKKAFVHIFILKMFLSTYRGGVPAIIYGLGKIFGFPQAFEILYVWKQKYQNIMLTIVLIWKMASPLFYWALLTYSSISWPHL